jgi:hypothetical protein
MRASNYFTPFRRVRGGQLDVFDVQWEKYWRPRFLLNFGRGDATSPDDEGRFERVGRLQRRRADRRVRGARRLVERQHRRAARIRPEALCTRIVRDAGI